MLLTISLTVMVVSRFVMLSFVLPAVACCLLPASCCLLPAASYLPII